MNNILFNERKYNLPKYFKKLEYTQRYCLRNPLGKTPDRIWAFYPDGTCEYVDHGAFDCAPTTESKTIDSNLISQFFQSIRECGLNRTDMILHDDDLAEELIIYTDKRTYILDRGIISGNTSIESLAWNFIESIFPKKT